MNWQPAASLRTLRARAELLGQIREFFAVRGVMEVDTPALSAAATVDPNIESLPVESRSHEQLWLHTSPEFAMKRLLAAGSGPIYQLSHVFRDDEHGRLHNPEFTLLEWYRPACDLRALMDEVETLMRVLVPGGKLLRSERISYQTAVQRIARVDPFWATEEELRMAVTAAGVRLPEGDHTGNRDFWLDLLMGAVVGPQLGQDGICFLHDYPASQAALARVRAGNPPVAERFELYWRGVELANGFHELADATEQKRRFAADQQRRTEQGKRVPPADDRLIDALRAGLPDCSGVAVGVDRLLMLILQLGSVSEAMPFPVDRA